MRVRRVVKTSVQLDSRIHWPLWWAGSSNNWSRSSTANSDLILLMCSSEVHDGQLSVKKEYMLILYVNSFKNFLKSVTVVVVIVLVDEVVVVVVVIVVVVVVGVVIIITVVVIVVD